MTKLWGGRFTEEPSELLRALNDSFWFDRALFEQDVQGSIAWAEALARASVLTADEAAQMTAALRTIPAPTDDDVAQHEDVHSYVESKLRAALGPLGGKLHTGRSRNDQVATDLRLWLSQAFASLSMNVCHVARALAERAMGEAATPMPGYTHLKQAEPVTFGHWCLAYVEMLRRDLSRITEAQARGNECPLGAGALSGTPLDIDRETLAKALGFARATRNSLDSVSDRDAATDYLYCASLLLTHLSRLAEDLIFFTSDEAKYAELPDSLATGSSRMPHKKNPDVLELVRGHAGRSLGELTGFIALLKGLPLAYDKDLQLDKEPLFRTHATLQVLLPALAALIRGLKLDRQRMQIAASGDLLLATELADVLAARGIPFREAHDIVSARIGEAIRSGRTLAELGPTADITHDDLKALDVERALSRRGALGCTSPQRVQAAAAEAVAWLGAWKSGGTQ